jgi:hypothetical protein
VPLGIEQIKEGKGAYSLNTIVANQVED